MTLPLSPFYNPRRGEGHEEDERGSREKGNERHASENEALP
jgi:hypothetical protein